MGKLPFEKQELEILEKRQADTDPSLGHDPNNIPMELLLNYGIVNIDKPKGPTSHLVSDFVKRILKLKKAGHSGSLDPAVTGSLPIAIGDATRIVQALLKAGKEYICVIHLHKDVKEEKIIKVMKKFIGINKQRPPIKSAVKRVERFRKIYYLDIIEIEGKDVLFKVGCEAGTYIRVLCHQIGEALKTGAHMAELRRTKVASFKETSLTTLQTLTDAFHYYKEDNDEEKIRKEIQPIEKAIEHLKKIWVLDTAVSPLCHGINLKIPGVARLNSNIEPDQLVAVMTLKDELIAIGIARLASNRILKRDKGIAVQIEKVFMKPELYKFN